MSLAEKVYVDIFKDLKKKGVISIDVENDFHEFCQVVSDTFEECPTKFKMDDVFTKLPKNNWIPLYMEHISNNSRDEHCLNSDDYRSLQTNEAFQEICMQHKNVVIH
jgi:hypothetical protein